MESITRETPTATVPGSVHALVRERMASLSAECRRVLEAASVLGPAFRVDELSAVVGGEVGDVAAHADEAVAAHVFEATGHGRYGFTHGLFRDALYGRLGEARRANFHSRVGQALDLRPLRSAPTRQEAGVADRATFGVLDAADTALNGASDLVCMFEVLHDVARPVELLRTVRRLLAPGGTALVVDERVAEQFTAPGDVVERFMYTCSVLHCLPIALVEQPSAATGTVMRPDTVRRYAVDAGFADAEILPIENDFFRFYRLRVASTDSTEDGR